MERSLVLIKPDAVQRGLVGEVVSRLENKGLKFVAMKMIHMDKVLAEKHYAIHKDKPFFKDLVSFIISSPIIAIVLQGDNAVKVIRRSMGETNPVESASGTIRGDYAISIEHNLIHGSDSIQNADKEINLFFSSEEILDYSRDIDRWI